MESLDLLARVVVHGILGVAAAPSSASGIEGANAPRSTSADPRLAVNQMAKSAVIIPGSPPSARRPTSLSTPPGGRGDDHFVAVGVTVTPDAV